MRGRKDKKKWGVKIAWGSEGDYVTTRNFSTRAEYNAYMDGVEDAEGWLSYYIEEEWEPPKVNTKEEL